jgi:hypothetical protein
MKNYGFHLDRAAENFSITKDEELLGEGNQAPSLGTYAFQFQDVSANEYEMAANGFFWWRRMQLFRNGAFDGSYTRTKAMDTDIELG